MSSADPTTIATLVFADGTAGGSTGCNLFHLSYSIKEDSITFGDPALTGFACHPDHVAQGDAVVRALQASERFTKSVDRLELTDLNGTVLLVFRPADMLPLQGINWRLAWYGAGTSPLDGTEITLLFRIGGTLLGVAGCNDYSADYQLDGESLHIGAITRTERACNEPDGVTSQERTYPEVINRAESYVTTLTGLELHDGTGTPIAEFRFGGRVRTDRSD